MTATGTAGSLWLRPDAYYAETVGGAYILTHHGEWMLTGSSVYRLIERLAPFLNGRHTLAELTADLPTARRDMVHDLVTALLERGVITEVEPGTGDLTAGHAHEVGYIGYFRDFPRSRFDTYARTMSLVVGDGALSAAVAAAAVRSGLTEVRVQSTADGGDPIVALPAGVGVVLHASDRPEAERARRLEELCADAGALLAHALVFGGHAWVAGAGVGLRAGVGWSSCLRRLLARRAISPTGEGPPVEVSALAATAVASHLVHGVFQFITATAESRSDQLTRIDLSTLVAEACTVLPHPLARPAPRTGEAERIARLRGGARLSDEAFSQRAMVCVGDETGVLGVPTERGFAQIPLHVCEIEVSDPVGLLDPASPAPTVIGVGEDFTTARHRAALSAFACYASLMIDPRRLEVVNGQPGDPGCDPVQTLEGLRSGRLTGLVRGYGLADPDNYLVSVTRVFTALRTPRRPYRPPPGVAAGYDWDEAVGRGLLDRCRRLTMAGLAAATAPFPMVDLMSAPVDACGARYRALLAAIDESVTVYDVTGPLGVPTMVCCIGSTPAGCASSLSAKQALTDALEQALLHYQAHVNDQPDYAPPPTGALPANLRGTRTVPLSDRSVLEPAALATALLDRGHRPIAVPLDHDPEVNSVMPYTVRVLLAHA